MKSGGLVPLLLSALFLEPDHPRMAAPVSEKAPIQHDAANCLLQIAVFGLGRELLLEQDNAPVLGALHMLAAGKGALTTEVQAICQGALMAIEGPGVSSSSRDHAASAGYGADGAPLVADGHCMVSYQWEHQTTIKRVVCSLQKRDYQTWFDLECMKGSSEYSVCLPVQPVRCLYTLNLPRWYDFGTAMDAMAGAVDGAEVFLYAVSRLCEFGLLLSYCTVVVLTSLTQCMSLTTELQTKSQGIAGSTLSIFL